MTVIYLVPKSEAHKFQNVNTKKTYLVKGVNYYAIPEMQDGAKLDDDMWFCPYCHSDNCGNMSGSDNCHEM